MKKLRKSNTGILDKNDEPLHTFGESLAKPMDEAIWQCAECEERRYRRDAVRL